MIRKYTIILTTQLLSSNNLKTINENKIILF